VNLGTPFFTTKDTGTGLGLSICFQIIKQHGGRIEIDTEAGLGAAFRIVLPCVKSLKDTYPSYRRIQYEAGSSSEEPESKII